MLEDPCPKCGHRRKPQMMSTRADSASLTEMWKGEGEDWQYVLLRVAVLVCVFLFFAFAVIPFLPS